MVTRKDSYSIITSRLIGFILIALCFIFEAQGQFRISINAPQLKLAPITLLKCEGGKIIPLQTLNTNNKGKLLFEGTEDISYRFCYLQFANGKQYDFLLESEQELTIHVDTIDLNGKTTISGNKPASRFAHYKYFLTQMNVKKERAIEHLRNATTPTQKRACEKEFATLDKKINKKINQLTSPKSSPYTAAFIRASMTPIELQREQFLKEMNLSYAPLWNSVLIPNKVNRWLEYQLKLQPDSARQIGETLMNYIGNDSFIIRYAIKALADFSYRHDLVSMEELRFFITEQYLEQHPTLLEPTMRSRVQSDALKNFFCKVGQTAQPLTLRDTCMNIINTEQIESPWLLLYFYEPNCGVCNLVTPALYTLLYKAYHQKGLQIVAICTGDEIDAWHSYIHQYNTIEWINASDPERTSYFWEYYNVSQTPALYLLDKERKIKAKNMPLDTLEQFIQELLENK